MRRLTGSAGVNMQKIHLDTDIGGDIDDLCALAMVLKWQGAELTGVTTVAEHVGTEHRVGTGGQKPLDHRGGKRAGMVHYVLGLAGRTDIPVAAGAEASLPCYRVFQGLPDEAVYWPEPIAPYGRTPCAPTESDPYGRMASAPERKGEACPAPTSPAPTSPAPTSPAPTSPAPTSPAPTSPAPTSPALTALDLLESSIEQGAIIVAIGPYTNLALLEQRSPGILQTARLVLMGGYVFPPRPGYPAWNYEMDWNVQVDVQSALYVLELSHPTLVPLAVTVETALRRAYLPRLRQSGPLGQLIARQAEAHAIEYKNEETYGQTCPGLPPDIINFQHDPLACAIALGWDEGVEVRELLLKSEIRDGWLRQTVDEGGKPARVVTAVDGERFNEFWLRTVAERV
jgi:inosine-uridine nucleoside N-ribohydrolase